MPTDPNAIIPAQTGDDSETLTPLDVTPFFDDVDGEELTFSSPDLPPWVMIDPITGVITGMPPADASQGGPDGDGVYIVTVVATDPDGEEVTTQVSYTISNPAPIAENDTYTTAEDTPLMINILTDNDSDPDGDPIVIDMVALTDGTIIPLGVPTEIPEGTLTVNTDGSVSFDPRLNFNGPVTFGYTLSDGQGGTDVATVSIDVTPVNDAPIPVDPTQPPLDPADLITPVDPEDPREQPFDPENYIPVQNGNDSETQPAFDLTSYFGDPDGMEPLTITLDPADLPSGLSFDPVTGVISGTPDTDASQGGDPGNPGTYVIEVTATDPSGESFTTNLTYIIANPPPIAIDDGVLDVLEDVPAIIDVTGNDTDLDGDDLAITEINGVPVTIDVPVELPSGAIVIVSSDGTVTYDPVENYNGSESFTYTISDGEGGTSTATVNLNVVNVNDAPGLISSDPSNPEAVLPPQNDVDGATIDPVDVSGAFEDIDGDILTFTASGLPDGLSIDPETGVITGTLPRGTSANGPFVVIITATDSDGASIETNFVWSVDNVPPVELPPTKLPIETGVDGQPLSIPTAPNFEDADGDELTYVAEGLPEGLTIDPMTGLITGIVPGSASVDGPYEITVTVIDAEGASASTVFTLEVSNPAPIIGVVDVPEIVSVGQPVVINVTDAVIDPDGDPSLTYSADDLPPGLTLDPDTGIISGTPTIAQADPFVFTVLVDDGEGGVTSVQLSLQVTMDGFIAPENFPIDSLVDGVDPYEFLEGQSIDLKQYFYDRALESRDDHGRMFGDKAFLGGMVASPIPGMSNDCAYLVVEAVAFEHNVNVQLASTLSDFCDVSVKSWDVDMANGADLPDWMNWQDGSDFMEMQRPLGVETINLRVRALIENGRTASSNVEIDLRTGTVTQLDDTITQAQTLDEQLKLEARNMAEGDSELLKALAG